MKKNKTIIIVTVVMPGTMFLVALGKGLVWTAFFALFMALSIAVFEFFQFMKEKNHIMISWVIADFILGIILSCYAFKAKETELCIITLGFLVMLGIMYRFPPKSWKT